MLETVTAMPTSREQNKSKSLRINTVRPTLQVVTLAHHKSHCPMAGPHPLNYCSRKTADASTGWPAATQALPCIHQVQPASDIWPFSGPRPDQLSHALLPCSSVYSNSNKHCLYKFMWLSLHPTRFHIPQCVPCI
jgi:hypothetical protein